MRLRWMGLPVALAVALALTSAASAQVRTAALQRVKLLNKKAMDEYDGLEFEAAKNYLNEALQVAREGGISRGATLVTVYINLGVVYGAGLNDRLNAVKFFGEALRLNPKANLDPTRSTPLLEEMFTAARDAMPARPPDAAPFRHTPPAEALEGRPLQVRASTGPELGTRKVVLYYRAGSSAEFEQIEMDEERPGTFSAVIPGAKIAGRALHYYIEAQDEVGRRLAWSGNVGSPHLVSIRPRRIEGDDTRPVRRRARPRFSFSVVVGIGAGVVYEGKSEHQHRYWYKQEETTVDVGSGAALAPFHIAPEISYHFTNRWELAGMLRVQVVNAATVSGSVSLLGLLRAKYHLGSGALRGLLSVGGGVGQVRHRIPLGDYDRGVEQYGAEADLTPNDVVDTRVAGLAALTMGTGLRYMFSKYVGLIAELNLIFLFTSQFAANADINTGLLVSF